MGVLGKPEHERFCQAVHAHLLAGKTRGESRTLAYMETVVGDDSTGDQSSNARRLANQPHIKARIQQIIDTAAALADMDKFWALIKLKSYVESPEGAEFAPVLVRDRIAAIKLIADMNGYMAPAKVANTDVAGNDVPPMTEADRARMIELIFAKSNSPATP